MIFLAFVIAGFGLFHALSPADVHHFELPMSQVGGGSAPQAAVIEPLSELKFRNIERQSYDYSCGSAALVTLLNGYLGLDLTEQQAMEGMLRHGQRDRIIARRGFSMLDMKRYVESLGVKAAGFRGSVDDLADLAAPVIVPIDYGGFKHFVVFRGVRGNKVFLADPSSGFIVLSVYEFENHWDKNTLFMVYAPQEIQPLDRLALADKELGVFDYDSVREGAADFFTRTDMLNRAAQSARGVYSLRK